MSARFAPEAAGPGWAVHVGGVEQRDAEFERAVERRLRLSVVAGSVGLAHAHAAQALRGDGEAEAAEVHGSHVVKPMSWSALQRKAIRPACDHSRALPPNEDGSHARIAGGRSPARSVIERAALGRRIVDVDDADSYECRPHLPGEIRSARGSPAHRRAPARQEHVVRHVRSGPGSHAGTGARHPPRHVRQDRHRRPERHRDRRRRLLGTGARARPLPVLPVLADVRRRGSPSC